MRYGWAVLLLAFAAPLAGQAVQLPSDSGVARKFAMDTAGLRQLADAWKSNTKQLACLTGHAEVYQKTPVTVFDAVTLADACGAPAIGVVTFLHGQYEEEPVLRALTQVLLSRKDLQFIGAVYAVEPVAWPSGGFRPAPRWWAVYR